MDTSVVLNAIAKKLPGEWGDFDYKIEKEYPDYTPYGASKLIVSDSYSGDWFVITISKLEAQL